MIRTILVFAAFAFTFIEVSVAQESVPGNRSGGYKTFFRAPSSARTASANQSPMPGVSAGENYYPVSNLEQGMKNSNLAKELMDLAIPCLGAIGMQNPESCQIEIIDHCRTQEAANKNAASGRGSAKSCHLQSRGCKAVDIGSISCGGMKIGPAESANPSDYYLEFAKCINGDDFKKGGNQFAGMPTASRQPASKGKQRGGVCYNDSCQKGQNNALGNCPMHSHADHIHFSGDGCGHGEHSHPKSVSSGNSCGAKNGMDKG